MLSQLINRECSITRRSTSGDVDELGNDISATDIVETVWEVQQRAQLGEREYDDAVSKTDWVGFFLPGEQLDSGDAVVDGPTGQEFEVVGDPWPVRNPRTRTASHVEANVKRTAGSDDSS